MKYIRSNSKSLMGLFLITPFYFGSIASASTVDVGSNQVITLADSAFLEGLVTNSNFPSPHVLPVVWSKVSGPGSVTFANNKENLTTVTFSSEGTYVLRLTIDDGSNTKDDVSIQVNSSASNTIRIPQDYNSIQEGLDAANAGDLILVSPGLYKENIEIGKTVTLASTFYTTGETDLISQTIIESKTSDKTTTVYISGNTGPETKVIGFTIKNGYDGLKIKKLSKAKIINNHFINPETDAVDFAPSAAGLVQNNTMEGAGDDAVDIDDANVIIDNNIMLNNGEGVEIRAKTVSDGPQLTIIIRNNTIKNSIKTGLQLIDDEKEGEMTETSGLLIIDHNLIMNSAESGLAFVDDSSTTDYFKGASSLERIHLYNNTFIGNKYGISGGDNVISLNNIFADTEETAINEVNGDSISAYNLFWNNGRDEKNSNVNNSGSIFSNPSFNASYQLQQGSSAIDSGVASYSLPSGETILNLSTSAYFGTAPDLGAYETNYGSGGGGNRSPVATNDNSSTLINTSLVINVADNDNDLDGNLDKSSVNINCTDCYTVSNGTLTNDGNGSFTYNPSSDYLGSDSFLYEICDTENSCDTATAHISVTAASSSTVATLVKIIKTSLFDPASPDPSGITYLKSTGTLLICDGEVNEMDNLFTGDNLFEMTVAGNLTSTSTTVKDAPAGFSNEPTGVSRVNPDNGHIYFSDDDDRMIYEIAPGGDGVYGTADDIKISSINTKTFTPIGNDPEGIAYAPVLGDLFLADGGNHEIYRISPGINGIFDGVQPIGDDIVTHFNMLGAGLSDPEGIEYDERTGHLLLIGEPENTLFEVTTSGVLVQTIDISEAQTEGTKNNGSFKPAGLALAPSSQNDNETSVYIADRGVDNDKDPDENDGRVFELSFSAGSPTNDAPIVNVGKDQLITFPTSASLKSRVTDDKRIATAALSWSKVSGPGKVTFSTPQESSTAASFSEIGIYVLKLTADDTEYSSSDELSVEVQAAGTVESLEARIISSSDDAENNSEGVMKLTSSGLDIADPLVGLRFTSIAIPPKATIKSAYIQFTAYATTETSSLATISGQAIDNAPTFTETTNDIKSREKTAATVSWDLDPWDIEDKNVAQRSPDISEIIQEIVDRDNWSKNNALALVIGTGPGKRRAVSFDRDPAEAPQLFIEYVIENEAKTDQVIKEFMVTPESGVVGNTSALSVAGSGESGNAVTYASSTPTTCTVTDSTLTMVAVGTCTVIADQLGNSVFNAADQVSFNLTIGKAEQNILGFNANPVASIVGNSTQLSVTSKGSSTSPVVYSSQTSSICSVEGATVSFIATGSCKISADQAEDANYYAAPQVTYTVNIGKGNQVLTGFTMNPIPEKVGDTAILSVVESGASENPVIFSSNTLSTCTVEEGNKLTIVAKGSCQLSADQAGNVDYNPAQLVKSISIESGFMFGDITGDNMVNILDVVGIISGVLASETPINGADCNGDTELSILDVVCTINIVLSGQ